MQGGSATSGLLAAQILLNKQGKPSSKHGQEKLLQLNTQN